MGSVNVCKNEECGISLVVQQLRVSAPKAGGPGFDPYNWILQAAIQSSHVATKKKNILKVTDISGGAGTSSDSQPWLLPFNCDGLSPPHLFR